MSKRVERHQLRLSFILNTVIPNRVRFVLVAGLFACLAITCFAAPCFADDGPKPDPSGTATGDKSAAVDAAGNPFVVAEPTDKNAPDYAAQKKAYDEYQAQVAKEPLAVRENAA